MAQLSGVSEEEGKGGKNGDGAGWSKPIDLFLINTVIITEANGNMWVGATKVSLKIRDCKLQQWNNLAAGYLIDLLRSTDHNCLPIQKLLAAVRAAPRRRPRPRASLHGPE